MSFERFTTCPVCGAHTPLIWKKQDGRAFVEMRSCPVHGLMQWKVLGSRRTLLGYAQSVNTQKPLSPQGSFMDRCDRWADLKAGGGYNGLRRVPPKRREEPYRK